MSESWGLDNADGHQRKGQKHVIESFIQWLNDGCNGRTFSVFMCCRYGKSDAIRNLSVLALEKNKACAALVVHPSPVLAEQLLDNSRLIGFHSYTRTNAVAAIAIADEVGAAMQRPYWNAANYFL